MTEREPAHIPLTSEQVKEALKNGDFLNLVNTYDIANPDNYKAVMRGLVDIFQVCERLMTSPLMSSMKYEQKMPIKVLRRKLELAIKIIAAKLGLTPEELRQQIIKQADAQ